MISICKTMYFEASHTLPFHKGKCSHLHGHSYKLMVEINGSIKKGGKPDSGMIIDFGCLKDMITKEVINPFDHRHLNNFVKNPTAEILVEKIARYLQIALSQERPKVHLEMVRLYETRDSYAEWRRRKSK